jgi:hypothetical protein
MGLRKIDARMLAGLALVGVLLAGCAAGGSGGSSSSIGNQAPQGLTANEIRSTLAGSSWRFKGPNNTGTTLYAEDGTSLVEVDGKGTTKGKWMTKDGQLCESFDPAPWLPGGVPMSCYPFARGAAPGTYQAGKAVFTQAS